MIQALRRTGSVAFVLLATACAAAPAPAPATQTPTAADAPAQPTASATAAPGLAPAPATAAAPDTRLDDAERELARAERELASIAGLRQGTKEAPKSEAAPKGDTPTGNRRASPPAKAPAAGGARKPADEADLGTDQRNAQSPTPCETACRALASMSRSADTICRLAGDGDPRCTSARRRVQDSASQAAACKCAQ